MADFDHNDINLLYDNGVKFNKETRAVDYSVWINRLSKIDGPYSSIAIWAAEKVFSEIRNKAMTDATLHEIKELAWRRYNDFVIHGYVNK